MTPIPPTRVPTSLSPPQPRATTARLEVSYAWCPVHAVRACDATNTEQDAAATTKTYVNPRGVYRSDLAQLTYAINVDNHVECEPYKRWDVVSIDPPDAEKWGTAFMQPEGTVALGVGTTTQDARFEYEDSPAVQALLKYLAAKNA